ncbi:hypothetical protein DFH07DRAFT_766668 [Mycena maculata]|uniref:Uncharacterized protein n=1 Tax=Mycena maculata TaxID=230809 RepID=A0AAD7K5C3_9AGAR|nr:hypothetical protein DFH07DRAFT_766668 [Mycena maculata]
MFTLGAIFDLEANCPNDAGEQVIGLNSCIGNDNGVLQCGVKQESLRERKSPDTCIGNINGVMESQIDCGQVTSSVLRPNQAGYPLEPSFPRTMTPGQEPEVLELQAAPRWLANSDSNWGEHIYSFKEICKHTPPQLDAPTLPSMAEPDGSADAEKRWPVVMAPGQLEWRIDNINKGEFTWGLRQYSRSRTRLGAEQRGQGKFFSKARAF